MTYDHIKIHKKAGFHALFRRYIFGKTTGGGSNWPPAFLGLKCREYVSNEHFEKLNWPPINQRFKQCVTSTVFKFVQNKCPAYMNEVSRSAENLRINTRNSYLKLNHPFRKTNTRKNSLSSIKPAIWKTKNLNTFKIRWNTTIWMISQIQINEILLVFIMLWL